MTSFLNSPTRTHIEKRNYETFFQNPNSFLATYSNKPKKQEILQWMFLLYKTS